jgi:hypothetical protein
VDDSDINDITVSRDFVPGSFKACMGHELRIEKDVNVWMPLLRFRYPFYLKEPDSTSDFVLEPAYFLKRLEAGVKAVNLMVDGSSGVLHGQR